MASAAAARPAPKAAELEDRLATALASGRSAFTDPVLAPLMRISPLFFATLCLGGPSFAPFHGRLLFSEHHYAWESIVTSSSRYVVLAARGQGKCMVAGSLIKACNGKRIPIEKWSGGRVWALDCDNWEFTPTESSPSFFNGLKPVLEIVTATGKRTKVTTNHPLRRFDGWTEAEALSVGDRIATPRKLPQLGNVAVPDAYLVGYMLGDGGMTTRNLCFHCTDPELQQRLRAEAGKKSWEVRAIGTRPGAFLFGQPQRYKRPAPIQWARDLGIDKKSKEKRVPKDLFEADAPSVWNFLSGFAETDTHIDVRTNISMEFYSVSLGMLEDIQHLLMMVGITSRLSRKNGIYKDQRHLSWRLKLERGALTKFAAESKLSGANKIKLEDIAGRTRSTSSVSPLDLLPREVVRLIKKPFHWHRDLHGARPSPRYEMTREKALRVAEAENNEDLRCLAEAEVLWERVVEINDLGIQPTYGIEVPGHENYVGDDIVQHNSHMFSFIATLWRLATQPGRKGFIFGGTEYAAQRILEEVRLEIEGNPVLQHLMPVGTSRRWTGSHIRCSNGHSVTARGMLTRTRGAHPDWITCDDILTDEDGWSELKRRRTADYYYSTISNMIMPGGQLGVVGTPQHALDLVMQLTENSAYSSRLDPALDANGESTWPEVYPTYWLEAHRREIGSVRFDREKMCRPVSDESSLFPVALFHQGETMQPMVKMGSPLDYWQSIGIEQVYIGVDFAFSASVAADYFVIMVLGVDGHENRWVMDMHRARGVSFSEQKSQIVSYGRRYEPKLLFLEANAAQQVAADELRRQTDLPIRKFVTTAAKHSLTDGLPALRELLEGGKMRLPRGDARSVELTDVLISEATNFTFLKGQAKSIGGHDDSVFGWYVAEQAVRRGRRSANLFVSSMGPAQPGRIDGPAMPARHPARPQAPEAPTTPPQAVKGRPLMHATTVAQPPAQQTVLRNGVYVRTDVGLG